MKSRKLFIGTMLLLIAIVSCKKENPEPNNPQTGQEQTTYSGEDTMVVKFIQKYGNGTLIAFRVSSGLDTWTNILLDVPFLSTSCQAMLSDSQSLTFRKDSVYTIHATINNGGIQEGGFHRKVKVVPNSSNNGLAIIDLEGQMFLGQYSVITCSDGVATLEINDQGW